MALQWLVTAGLVAMCFAYVVKTMLPKAGAAKCGGGCAGCSSGRSAKAQSSKLAAEKTCVVSVHSTKAQPLVFYPRKSGKF